MSKPTSRLLLVLSVCLPLCAYAWPQGGRQRKLTAAGTTVMCNAYKLCPSGYTCMGDPDAPGNMACFLRVQNAGQRRPGRCPQVQAQAQQQRHGHGGLWQGTRTGQCDFHIDCPQGQRCCVSAAAGGRRCTQAQAVDDSLPRLTTLVAGQALDIVPGDAANTHPLNKSGRQISGTMTLVQSRGRAMIFDTGTPGAKIEMLDALAAQGLTLEDIEHVEMSHGHPDHGGNIGMFDGAPGGVGQYDRNIYGKKRVMRFPEGSGGDVYGDAPPDSQYYVFNDTNLLIVKANGHTMQDTSLVVSNVPGMGTVILAGDMFVNANDYINDGYYGSAEDPKQARKSRKWAACLADYIVPGHGPMFKPSDALKATFGGCN